MDGAVMDLSVEGAETSRGVSAQQLPLTFVSAGETVKVIKVRGRGQGNRGRAGRFGCAGEGRSGGD